MSSILNNLSVVVREIVAATGYPAEDLLDGIVIEQPFEDIELAETYPGTIRYTRFERDHRGQKVTAREPNGQLEYAAWIGRADLPTDVWDNLQEACLAEDPALKGRKLVGGVELRNFHSYFLPSGEQQQWISSETFKL